MSKNSKSRTFSDRKQHLYRYRSSCTGTHGEKGGSGQHVPVHPSSGQHVPVQVEHVLVHPSSEQPIPVQVEPVPVQVVLAAPI